MLGSPKMTWSSIATSALLGSLTISGLRSTLGGTKSWLVGVVRWFFLYFGISHPHLFLQVVISIERGSEEDVFTEEITTFVISIDGDANDSELEVTDRVMKYTLVEYLNLS